MDKDHYIFSFSFFVYILNMLLQNTNDIKLLTLHNMCLPSIKIRFQIILRIVATAICGRIIRAGRESHWTQLLLLNYVSKVKLLIIPKNLVIISIALLKWSNIVFRAIYLIRLKFTFY